MASPPNSSLTDTDRALLSARADQFFGALNRNDVDDWEPFLDGLSGATRIAVLTELVIIDLGFRWGKGEKPTVELYVDRFPELGPLDRVPAALIREEHRCRAKAGDPVRAQEYRDRFPVQFDAIAQEDPSFAADPGTIAVSAGAPQPSIAGPGRTTTGESVVSFSNQYELVRELGRGMFGEVWLAKKNPSGIEKAIKILLQPADRETAKRELRSLELIKNLRHPFLLSTEDFWVAENRLYVVMELADATLRGRLKECKAEGHPGIPDDELLNYTIEAAEGLDYLHTKKITHRDVKPDNILILNGHSKVADFGLARQQEQMMASMSFAGTPAYMAPEVWGGEGGPASDQYGLAAAYAELRQGHPPFHFGKGAEVMFAHLEGHFNFSDTITEPEREVLKKAMSRNSEDRYPNCSNFAQALAAALGRSVARRSGPITAPSVRVASTPSAERTGRDMRSIPSGLQQTTDLLNTSPELRPRPEPVLRPTRPAPAPASNKRFLVAGIATLGLVGAIVGLVIMMFGDNPDPSPPTNDSPKPIVNNGGPTPPPVTPPPPPPPPMPPPIEVSVPRGTKMEEGSQIVTLADGKVRVPEWVSVDRNGQRVRFRLITPSASIPNAPPPFYISESKVWNGLYRGDRKTERPEPGGADAPAMSVTANDAAKFAATFDGGRLPTPFEWDIAAGFWDRRDQEGPVRRGGQARIGRSEPAPTTGPTAAETRNQYDLVDMAGNGREWTCFKLVERGQPVVRVVGSGFDDKDLVVLRGRLYTLRTPLSYDALNYEREQEIPTGRASVPSPYTGFRIVLPVPSN